MRSHLAFEPPGVQATIYGFIVRLEKLLVFTSTMYSEIYNPTAVFQ